MTQSLGIAVFNDRTLTVHDYKGDYRRVWIIGKAISR
jgi:hypothetical protein